jgi:hypothetical protein
MWTQIRTAAVAAALLAGTAALGYAQSTLDPRGAAGSSTTNRLGPSTPSPATGGGGALGAGDTRSGNWSGTTPSTGANPHRRDGYGAGSPGNYGTRGGATGSMPGTGTGASGFRAGSGAAAGGSATGTGPSGGAGAGAVGGGR